MVAAEMTKGGDVDVCDVRADSWNQLTRLGSGLLAGVLGRG